MEIRPLDVLDTWVCTPRQFADERGTFLEWFRADLLAAHTGRRFDVLQANHSVTRQDAARGMHYVDTPPGQAKLVYCSRGAVLDVLLDVRVGSPTFGRSAAVQLDDVDRRSVFVAEGIAHGFYALSEIADVTYAVSTTYDPTIERAVHAFDPALGLPWPGQGLLSAKDAAAPSLADARDAGVLPAYDECRAWYASLAVG